MNNSQNSRVFPIFVIGIIIGVAFCVVGFLLYITVMPSSNGKDNNNTKCDIPVTDNTSVTESIPGNDLSFFLVMSETESAMYGYLDNGVLYYTTKKNGSSFAFSYSKDYYHNYKKYDGITNIKRIKGYNVGSGIGPMLIIITEGGKTYSTKMLKGNEETLEFTEVELLKDTKVKDIVDVSIRQNEYYKVVTQDDKTVEVGDNSSEW